MSAVLIITGICMISVVISYAAFRRGSARSADDYFVAGSSLGYFVLIFSLLSSFLSAFSMFGMSSLGYRTGFGALFVLCVNLVPLGFLWYFMHRKTFILGRSRKWVSMGAPFGERYGNGMRVLIPVVTILASIPYLVAQIQGIGLMLEAMSEAIIPYKMGLLFVPAFIAVYLIMGGMKGAAWVNTVQGIFFSVMVFVLFFTVMMKNGGFGPTMDLVYERHPELFQLGAKGGKVWSYPMVFGFAAAMCLGSVCFPQPYMHAYSSRSAKGFKAMVVSFGGLCMILVICTTLVGIASTIIIPGLKGVQADKVYGLVATAVLPNWLAALAVAGGFTAAMSTVNGLVFGNATNVSNDLYKLLRPSATSGELVTVARLAVGGIMIICVILAWNPNTPVAELSVIAFGMVAVTIFPLWGAYFWKRATRHAAIASTLAGVGMNLTFFAIGGKSMVLFPQASLLQLNGFLMSLVVAGIVFVVGSLITQPGDIENKSLAIFFHSALTRQRSHERTDASGGVYATAEER
ncbi:sodium:solute symporter family protein [Desulfonema magnum]|uniref:Na+/solute symporter family protein n=1 Tax=Desulfonema magnum TaxID=45655 RepID=A0A975GKH3_9BACT|nr:sodium:solute symporter family protein [Desulfonema magnum]QTA84749.1 Na+/solute symporter family protein [Desulfonema magnum]